MVGWWCGFVRLLKTVCVNDSAEGGMRMSEGSEAAQ